MDASDYVEEWGVGAGVGGHVWISHASSGRCMACMVKLRHELTQTDTQTERERHVTLSDKCYHSVHSLAWWLAGRVSETAHLTVSDSISSTNSSSSNCACVCVCVLECTREFVHH